MTVSTEHFPSTEYEFILKDKGINSPLFLPDWRQMLVVYYSD